MTIPLHKLPNEMLLAVLSHLELKDLGKFEQTSRRHADLVSDNAVWQPRYRTALSDTFTRIPEVCVVLRKHRDVQRTENDVDFRAGLKALTSVDLAKIRTEIDAVDRRGEWMRGFVADPRAPHIAQSMLEILFFSFNDVRQLMAYSPLGSGLLSPCSVRAALFGVAAIVQSHFVDSPLARLLWGVVGLMRIGVGHFTCESSARAISRATSDTEEIQLILLAAFVGFVEVCAVQLGNSILNGAGNRLINFAAKAARSRWISPRRQAQVQAERVRQAIPDWVVRDLSQL